MSMAFPLDKIGALLRKMSLSGSVGNIVAIILYITIALLPVIGFLYLRKKDRRCKADVNLLVLSILLFVVIYYMINPGLYSNMEFGGDIVLGGTFYSVLVSYFLLRVLEQFKRSNMEGLKSGLRILLYIIIILLLFEILAELLTVLPENIQTVRDSNTALFDNSSMDSGLRITLIFIVLHSVVDVIPYIMDIVVTVLVIRMINELMKDGYSDKAIKATNKLADWSLYALSITTLSSMIFNLLQLLMFSSLHQTNISVIIPLFSIVFVLAALLFARYIQENQKLKQDNDLFI